MQEKKVSICIEKSCSSLYFNSDILILLIRVWFWYKSQIGNDDNPSRLILLLLFLLLIFNYSNFYIT